MSAVKTTLCYSPLSGKVFWGKVNTSTGVAVGNTRKDVTNDFLQCVELKFPLNTAQNITVNGAPHSTIYNIAHGRDVLVFDPANPDEIDHELYNKLSLLVGLAAYDMHGCCEVCRMGLDADMDCECDGLKRKQTMVLVLSKR